MKALFTGSVLAASMVLSAVAFAKGTVKTQAAQVVTCSAVGTSNVVFTATGATRQEAEREALRLCAASPTIGDCSTTSCH